MTTNQDYECPSCGSQDLDDGSFDYDYNGTKTHTPQPPHFDCMNCDWSGAGSELNCTGDYMAMLEDKADGEREERMLAAWEQTLAMKEHNTL